MCCCSSKIMQTVLQEPNKATLCKSQCYVSKKGKGSRV